MPKKPSNPQLQACVQHCVLQLENRSIPYNIIRSQRKSLGLQVYRDGRVVARAPQQVASHIVIRFVEAKSAWIEQKLIQFANYPVVKPLSYAAGSQHLFKGERYTLTWGAGKQLTKLDVCEDHKQLLLAVSDPSETLAKTVLHNWYRSNAKIFFDERLQACFANMKHFGIKKPELKVRKMRRRWGSCRQSGVITLNLELIKYAPIYLDYVIYHELCHLIEFNHSPRFYRLLTSVMSDHRVIEQELQRIYPS